MKLVQVAARGISALSTRLWTDWVAPVAIVLWSVVAGFLSVRRHDLFVTNILDLGYYTQVLWNTAHGRWFANSLKHPSFLADHFSPILLLIAPLFRLFPDARTLLVVEAVTLGASIIPLYLVLRSTHPKLAPLLVIGFVFNLTLHRLAFEDFHEIMLAAPALSAMLYAIYFEKKLLFVAAVAATLLVREDMGLYVAIIGLYLMLFSRSQRRFGLMILAVGVAWTAALTLVVIPAIRHEAYAHFSASGLINGSPRAFIGGLLTKERGWAVLEILIPLAGLPLLARGEQLLWLAPLVMLLALPDSNVGALRAWYVAPLLPLLWGTVAMQLARWKSGRAVAVALCALFVCTAISFRRWSPFPGGPRFNPAAYKLTDRVRTGHAILDYIPDDVPVVAQTVIGAHLATRTYLKLFPWFERDGQPKWLVFDEQSPGTYPLTPDELHAKIDELKHDPHSQIVHEEDGYIVFKIDAP